MVSSLNSFKQLVLVADDDPRVRRYVKAVLQTANFEILEAVDGIDALDILRTLDGHPDLVITDIRMPRMTGNQLVEILRAWHPGLPILVISGEPAEEDIHHPERGIHFVEKPFSPVALLQAVQDVMFPRIARPLIARP